MAVPKFWAVLVCALTAACEMPPLQHDGPVVPLGSGKAGGRQFEAFGFRRGDQGCVGWERGSSREMLCSVLLGPDEVLADEDFGEGIDLLLGRAGSAVTKVELVSSEGTVSVAIERGDREGFFATRLPLPAVDEVVVYGQDGNVLRRYGCRGLIGYPSLVVCLVPPP